MDSFAALPIAQNGSNPLDSYQPTAKQQLDSLVTTEVLANDAASVNVDIDDVYKSLTVSAQKIISKLNELLGDKVPGGVESLKPADYTPEKTADSIVGGIAGLFDAYAKSNADLAPEELISRFFAAARKGVDSGYGDAHDTLEGIGAFEVDGVQDGVEQTKGLIDEKLKQLEAQKRRDYGLTSDDSSVSSDTAKLTSTAIKAGAGTTVASVGHLDISA